MQSTEKPKQKTYRQGSGLYFSAGLLLSMVLIITAFEWKSAYQIIDTPIVLIEEPLSEDDFKPVVLPAVPSPPRQSPNIEEVPEITPTMEEPPIEPLLPDDEEPEVNPLEGLFTEGNPFGVETPPTAEVINREAAPVDGYKDFYDYLHKNLRVPEHLLDQRGETRIVISFVVDTDGRITDISLAEGSDKELERQVKRLLEKGPAWAPAWQHDRKVRVRKALPIVIKTNR
ncbi:energy transducer TonB [Cesiribacter andamanensis]|uniref:Gram-negative bacterial tonB protein n=1 Tax=Cesiribacter andamanensis AMV16 TaxID=1279009 RepID=M7NS73_9BACT|nr:energy transducer TonB [Cesiribacter andamanensis]EMR04550.1 Gram-negative bacterial tonB protein [Cesiribacter andamanensis AMV16]